MATSTRNDDFVLELRRGDGSPTQKSLRAGVKVDPFSLGRSGAWTIDASGVAEVHGYLYWDGSTLFVQSASPGEPLRVNGTQVGAEWSAVALPATIALGDARISYAERNASHSIAPRPAAGAPRTSPPPARLPSNSGRPPPPKSLAPSRRPDPVVRAPSPSPQRDERDVRDVRDVRDEEATYDEENTRAFMPAVVPPSAPARRSLPPVHPAPAGEAKRARAPVPPPVDEDYENTRAFIPAARTPTSVGVGDPRAHDRADDATDDDDFESTRALGEPPAGAYTGRAFEGEHGSPLSEADDDRTKIVPLPVARPAKVAPAPKAPAPQRTSAPRLEPAQPAVVIAPEALMPSSPPSPPSPPSPASPLNPPSTSLRPPAADAPTPASSKAVKAPSGGGGALAKLKADWAETSLPKKLIVMLMPVLLVLGAMWPADPPASSKGAGAAAVPSASLAGGPAPDDEALGKRHKKRPKARPADDDDDDGARVVAPSKRSVDAGVASVASSDADAGDAMSPATPTEGSADAGTKSLERVAADAVVSGDLARALKIYRQLAKANPDDESYPEIVRVLKSKIATAEGRRKKRDE